MDTRSTVQLNNGVEMPCFGLGTWRMSPREAGRSVAWALEAGYRLIDTAKLYANERDVGAAVRESGIPREQVFVTTKLVDSDQGYRSTFRAFEESMAKLGFDYVDLYLVHFPTERRTDSWKAMLEILDSGRVRAIGVSNYMTPHLEELMAWSGVAPAVNQVMTNPYFYMADVHDYCRRNGIVMQGYSPLTQGRRLGDPRLQRIGARYGKTPAQVLIRWSLQKGIPAIPKTVHHDRVIENSKAFDFELEPDDMDRLDRLNEAVVYP